jgi:hypothetical protein
MIQEEKIAKMMKAINQAIKVMGDRFGSTEEDVARAIQELKASLQPALDSQPGQLECLASVFHGGLQSRRFHREGHGERPASVELGEPYCEQKA